MSKYDAKELKNFVAAIMHKAGLGEKDSCIFADSLLEAEMRGISSHGLTRLKTYAKRLEDGLVEKKTDLTVLKESPSFLLIDANNGMGACSAFEAMNMCIRRAKESGACFAAVRGGNHFGIGGYFSDVAAKNNMIGIAMTNGPAAMPAVGGKKPLLGTNPLAVSIPLGKGDILSLDMATSVVARGKITLAKKEGKIIPEGWGVDSEGLPTTDPSKVVSVLPFGGAKGFGLALIIEILCSCLSGACNGQTMGSFYDFSGKTQGTGFFLGALDIGKIMPIIEFTECMEELTGSIKNSPRAENCDRIYLPGGIESEKKERAAKDGIAIPHVVAQELKETGEKFGIAFFKNLNKEGCSEEVI